MGALKKMGNGGEKRTAPNFRGRREGEIHAPVETLRQTSERSARGRKAYQEKLQASERPEVPSKLISQGRKAVGGLSMGVPKKRKKGNLTRGRKRRERNLVGGATGFGSARGKKFWGGPLGWKSARRNRTTKGKDQIAETDLQL